MVATFLKTPLPVQIIIITFLATSPLLSPAQKINKTASTHDTSNVDKLNNKSDDFLRQDSDSGLYFAQAAYQLAKKIHYKIGEAKALINTGAYQQTKGKFTESMNSFLSAIELLQRQSSRLEGTAYLGLAQIYKDMSADNTKQYIDKGVDYSRIAYTIFANLKDTAGMANSLSMAGILFRDKTHVDGQLSYYDSAYTAFSSAIKLVKATRKDELLLAKFYNNISQVYLEYKKNYREGLRYLLMAVSLNQKYNSLWGLTHNYGNIAETYVEMKDYSQALVYARKMLATSTEIKRPARVYNSYKVLYTTFSAAKKYDSALYYHILATKVNDSLTNINRTGQVLDLQIKYETARKELEIQKLHQDNASQSLRIILLIAALLAMTGIAIAIIVLYRRVQRQKKELNEQSKRLELMMKELHHRVKNNLQIVSTLLTLQTYKSVDEQVTTVLKESQQRVEAMSLIHQSLYKKDEFTNINIKEYIRDLVHSLMSSYGYSSDNFELKLNISKEMLDIDKALPIGLILNEMVTNSFKYAYRNVEFPSLLVSLSTDEKNILLSVKDNGPGIDEVEWKRKTDFFGKQLIVALSKQLRAKQQIVVDHGTEFNLVIPKKIA